MQRFALPSALTIETVEALLASLRDVPLGAEGIALEAGKVESITTPGVQVIVSLSKSLEQMGGKLKIEQPSAALTQAFQTLGLGEQLTQWSSANG